MNNKPHNISIDLEPPHHCHFCQAPLYNLAIKDYTRCGKCKTTHSHIDNKLVSYRMYVKINKSACFLYVDLVNEYSEILMNSKYLSISWETAQRITPDNIQKRLKTILVFS